ncbi:hypothetical protein CTheo_469 [Ceratobasidium theobromae]|uniref:GATA-type domain-containing protein n=1 Tax=Ceratobasidium theobromae TaxID=1582974 RepID=A0A5N5QZ74_9AGAM|nr:hypothetical protein CTheo_469 [Ceratobasidium theobromae]
MQLAFDSVLEESQRAVLKQHPVPAFGHTRCYWSLLDSELRYLYLDPACFAHMAEQATGLIGTCLLDYVHPDEQQSARADLRNVLDSRTLHGSVTRVRYARLSRIRSILGCKDPEPFPDAELVTVDDHYIACDVVINWVSDNVVLCFLHAIVDKGKADNDELHKTDWTNWCGTAAMTTDHATELYDRLQRRVTPSRSPPDRIFQILINQPARPILFSWPPEGYTAGEFGKLVHRMQIGGPGGHNQPKSEDGAKTSCTRRYKANQQVVDAGTLKEVESIFIPHGAVIFACHKVVSPQPPYSDTQGRANASAMYQPYPLRQQPSSHYPSHLHQQPVVQGHYDSDVRRSASGTDYSASGVPGSPEYPSRATTSGYQRGPAEYGAQYGMRDVDYAHGSNYVQQYNSSYPIPANQQRNEVYAPAQPHAADHRNIQDRAEGWEYSQAQAPHTPAQSSWPAASSPRPTSPRPHGPYEGQSWMVPQGWPQGAVDPASQHQQQGYPYHASQPFGPPPLPAPQQQPLSPPPPYAPNTPVTQPPPHLESSQPKRDPSSDEDPAIPRVHAPPKRKRDPAPKREPNGTPDPSGDGAQLSPPAKDVIARERGHSAGAGTPRVGGAPPPGILRCSSCKCETSPEWRKGPSGKKDLCNACGLRYARSKQKKDGLGLPKRRRDKEVPLAPAPAPPAASPHLSHGPGPASASASSSSTAPGWPSVLGDGRDPKRVRSEAFTSSHSPSPPHSETRSQPEHYPDTYPGRYGQTVYPQGYSNGYNLDYGRVPGPVPSYVAPELSSSDRSFGQ